MSAVAHYIEDAGVPTTGISLVREQTERMRPPRALWVPFPLGRPFGAADDAVFQLRVLRSALALFERTDGPVILEDFPDDAPAEPEDGTEGEGLVCPVPLPRGKVAGPRDLPAAVQAEMATLAPWYDLARERRGRTTVGVGGLSMPDVIAFLGALLAAKAAPPAASLTLGQTLRFAAEDLRTWYTEAAGARPGGPASPAAMATWFWTETRAGELLLALHPVAARHADRGMQEVAARYLIPRIAAHLIPKGS